MRRIFASGFWAGFVLSFRWRVELFGPGKSVFDSDYDPRKSLLHVLAQRLPRVSRARTCHQDCFSPLLMHLDVGKVDLTSHTHVPAVIVQSYAPSDDPYYCAGHAAPSHLKGLPLLGEMTAPKVSEIRWVMSLRSLDVVWATSWLGWIAISDESQMQWSSAGKPAMREVPRRSMKTVRVARFRAPPPDAKRQSRVSPCPKSAIRCPTSTVASCLKSVRIPEVSRSWHERLPEFKASPLAKRRTANPATITRAEVRTRGSWTTTPPRSATESSDRSWEVLQVCSDAHASSG